MRLLTGLLGLCVLSSALPASAAVVTRTYDFMAGPYNGSDNSLPPYLTTSGSFTVTYDTAVFELNKLGVVVNSLSVPYTAPFTYSHYSDDSLALVSSGYDPSTATGTGFALVIRNASGPATGLSGTSNYRVAGYNATASTRTVIFALGASSEAPEPATWAMLIVGFGFVGQMLRRVHRRRHMLPSAG